MSNITTSENTNEIGIPASVAIAQEHLPHSGHVTESNGHPESLIPDPISDLLDGTTLKQKLLICTGI